MTRRTLSLLGLAGLTVVATSACADSDDPALAPLDEAEVTISMSRYGPREIVVSPGATVSFTNQDPFAHTVTGKVGTHAADFLNSGNLGQDEVYEVTFDQVGEHRYFCEIHPTMVATVTVVA